MINMIDFREFLTMRNLNFSKRLVLLFIISLFLFSFASAQNATRTLPSTYVSGSSLIVNISINFNSSACGGAVIETLPIGWTVIQNSTKNDVFGEGLGYYNSLQNTITWAPIDNKRCGGSSNNYSLSYIVTPGSSQSGVKTFTGLFSIDGIDYSVLGSSQISKQVSSDPPSGNNNPPSGGNNNNPPSSNNNSSNNSNLNNSGSYNINYSTDSPLNDSDGNDSSNSKSNLSKAIKYVLIALSFLFFLGIVSLIIYFFVLLNKDKGVENLKS